jgi:hypothetical protein
MMKIFGVDFTSSPHEGKPITYAACTLHDGFLGVAYIGHLTDFPAFDAFLMQAGPWVAGFDFPVGQARKLIENLGWPRSWANYITLLDGMKKEDFEALLKSYRDGREPGDKHHLRRTDIQANARSPMMLHGVPVGKMFFQGAPRLLRSGASVLPCHPVDDNRVALEGYPALVARKWIGNRSYKSDARKNQSAEREQARRDLVVGLFSETMRQHYGFGIELDTELAVAAIEDPTADLLDALLCAIQAAWAFTRRGQNFGIPETCDALEGWIVDPDMLREWDASVPETALQRSDTGP